MKRHDLASRSEPARARRTHTTTAAGGHGVPAAHHGRVPFRSAMHGPMRRDYELNRFLYLTAKFRRV